MLSTDKQTPYTPTELIQIFNAKSIDETLHDRFIQYYFHCYSELYESYKDYNDEDFEDGESIQESALYVTNLYVEAFLSQIEKGHDQEWAHIYAYNHEDREGEERIYFTCEKLKEQNPQLAQKNLEIHCRSLGEDEHFQSCYLQMYKDGDGEFDAEESARNYSTLLKDQVSKGKSFTYAKEYARLMALSSYIEIFCEEYAYAFDKAIVGGKTIDYAREYAELYATEVEHFRLRFDPIEDMDLLDYNISKINAYMNAWEYLETHSHVNREHFITLYKRIYMDTYYADIEDQELITPETDVKILEKVRREFEIKNQIIV